MFSAKQVDGGDDNSPPKPFLTHAITLHRLGLSIIPCEGKKALLRWKKYQIQQPGQATIYRWFKKFSDRNIGIITGSCSKITVIDCDNPDLTIEELENEFGESGLIVLTPSGGKHLYYNHNGEASGSIRNKVDIKGKGGLIISPHSYNHDQNRYYKIIKGSLTDLKNLTNLKSSSSCKATAGEAREKSDFIIKEGGRNAHLFNQLIAKARCCASYEKLEEIAFEINLYHLLPSLSADEVRKTASSVWTYKENGTLPSKNGGVFMAREELDALALHPRAFWLLAWIKAQHFGIRQSFFLEQTKLANRFGWNRKTFKKVIKVLLQTGYLVKLKSKNEKMANANKIKTPPHEYKFGHG